MKNQGGIVMEIGFRNVKREGSIITAECEHNRGEHYFEVRIEGATALDQLNNLKLITNPPEYAKEEYAVKGAVSLLHEVLETKQNYIETTGFIYSLG